MANLDHEKSNDSYPQATKHGRDDVTFVLDERRRAALADVDNAEFSYVFSYLPFLTPSHLLQLVPCQSLPRRWCWLLYRCVSPKTHAVQWSKYSFIIIKAMISSP